MFLISIDLCVILLDLTAAGPGRKENFRQQPYFVVGEAEQQ